MTTVGSDKTIPNKSATKRKSKAHSLIKIKKINGDKIRVVIQIFIT